jgi:hyaluronoglucosaminidase
VVLVVAVLTAVIGVGAVVSSRVGDSDSPPLGPGGPSATTTGPQATTRPPDAPPPAVLPTPRQIAWLGPDVAVPEQVVVHAGDGIDDATTELVRTIVEGAGAEDVTAVGSDDGNDDDAGDDGLDVWVGTLDQADITDALDRAGVDTPQGLPAEGYALAVGADAGAGAGGDDDDRPALVLAGVDADGAYYAAQTLRQLVNGDSISGVTVVDQPSMEHRGTIEGFYGSPWSQAERLDQLAFYGEMKLNTYIYAPKDDPFHRDQWREPYPTDRLAALGTLVETARAHHVDLTFAVSPGVSICFSDAADVAALRAKLSALYDLGVRDFAIALDDIERQSWHCDADQATYGDPTDAAAAQAQVNLLNDLQHGFVAEHEGTRSLVLVPTEYQGIDDSPYRTLVREQLDPAVSVMWTGNRVVPAEITTEQATAIEGVFGRPTYVWDNYPVNDFARTEGRLMLGPYVRRATDLDQHVEGLVSNPMNQAAASKVALVGVADLTWNSPAYDPARAHRAAAEHLATGSGNQSATTVESLLAFFDVESLAPTSDRDAGVLNQGQAPVLASELDELRTAWAAGDKAAAVDDLRAYAQVLAQAPTQIRVGVGDAAFVEDCRPWLDALDLWGQALLATLDGLDARAEGDTAGADAHFSQAADLAAQAQAVRTVAGETLPQGPVRVGDGVLDAFVSSAPQMT